MEARRRGSILTVVRMGNIQLGTAGIEEDKGRATLPVDKTPGKPVEVEIGDDGIQGRVLREDKGSVKARHKDNRADQLAKQLEAIRRDVAALLAENEALRQQLRKAELEVRSLQCLLERKEQELKKARPANGK
jgi:hypothetical protein